jgi:hypothetical protein
LAEALEHSAGDTAWQRFMEIENRALKHRVIFEPLDAPIIKLALDMDDDHDRAWSDLFDERKVALREIEQPFLRKLLDGELMANGYEVPLRASAQKQEISGDMWRFLRPLYLKSAASGAGIRFEGVSVWIASVASEATGGAAPPDRRNLTIKAETNCRKWLEELMAEESSPDHPKSHYSSEAQERFENLGTRAFERAWGNAVATANNPKWSRPGRKS